MEVDRLRHRAICVISTSRADYGYLRGVMREIRGDAALRLQLIVGGSHLSRASGETVRDIERDGFAIDRRIEFAPASDDASSAVRALGLATLAFADALPALAPDIVVLLGDRYEILAPAAACLLLKIPLAHVHGGEATAGALDDSVRHAVTKLATYHFPATEAYRHRIVQMGEDPERVFNCGSPGLDALAHEQTLTRDELSERLAFALDAPTALVAFHPATRATEDAAAQVAGMLEALDRSGLRGVVTRANNDPGGAIVNAALEAFCAAQPGRFRLFEHLGPLVFHSALRHLDVMVGNSSSGIIEAPSFRMPVVNIGDRQQGRVRAANVLDRGYSADAILDGLRTATTPAFRRSLERLVNPYDERGDGRASWRIKEHLKDVSLDASALKKQFRDARFVEAP